jgi:aminoglycoside phosphotransferase (APT) family kinase protein
LCVRQPGRLLASGRDSDIFECGEGLVLRRSRAGRSLAQEARTMEYARSHGYPVPAIEELSDDGADLVMERIDGLSMVDLIAKRPWAIRGQGALLADLHRRLHEIPAPEWAGPAPAGEGDRLLHLDLHPLNVMVGKAGPVVIDWARAARGDGNVDVAIAWALLACAEVPGSSVKVAVLGKARSVLVKAFLRPFDVAALRRVLPAVVEWKAADPHMSDVERRNMRALAGA